MQPTRRQVPPSSGSFSMHATRAPSCAARIAAVYPPGPPPRTATSTSISTPRFGRGSAGDRTEVASADAQDDLPELAAGRELVVGGLRLVEREGRVHRDRDGAALGQRGDVPLEPAHDERLLLERPRSERRRVDPRAALHQLPEVDRSRRARADADDDETSCRGEELDVLDDAVAAHELEHDVVGAGDVGVRPERLDTRTVLAVPDLAGHARARGDAELDGRDADAAGRAAHEEPLAQGEP